MVALTDQQKQNTARGFAKQFDIPVSVATAALVAADYNYAIAFDKLVTALKEQGVM